MEHPWRSIDALIALGVLKAVPADQCCVYRKLDWKRRMGNLGTYLSWLGRFIGRPLAAVLICVGAVLMSGAANAKAHPKASAAPVLDAQAVNAAQLPARAGKGRAPAPSTAAEVLLDRVGFSPGQIDGK